MTIYWERCSICTRHYPTRSCWLNPSINVCPHCCILCIERSRCPKPVWYPELKAVKIEVGAAEKKREEAVKLLEELLRKLGG